MDRKAIIEFITQNPLSFMATVDDDGTPHVRGMMTCRVDDRGLLFATGRDKPVCRQIRATPQVELCYYSASDNSQVRVSGTVEFLEDLETKEEVLQRFPFLKPRIEKDGWDTLSVFILRKGRANTWSATKPFGPRETFEF